LRPLLLQLRQLHSCECAWHALSLLLRLPL
jgi:hypothetical protein